MSISMAQLILGIERRSGTTWIDMISDGYVTMSHGVWHDAVQNKLTDLKIKFCEIICGIRNIKVSKYEEKNLARLGGG
jgi:hypothetical protein